ncbi:MAG: arsenate reductase [Glaciecola sp.]
MANDSIEAKSAGSQPAGIVHPLSLKYLKQAGYSTHDLHSQSWDDFEDFHPDVVVTVCDSAAGETCPVYFSNSIKLHWGLSDPSKVEGDEAAVERAFSDCIDKIAVRVKKLRSIADSRLDQAELKIAVTNLINDGNL